MDLLEGNTKEMPSSDYVSTKQQKIAELARSAPNMSFLSLNHHLTLKWLEEAYRLTRKNGATGIDGQTAEEFSRDLETNLRDLLDRAKSSSYFAPPVRRAYIPKDGPGQEVRPLGIPTFSDKLLQRAVSMLLEPIYEQDFLPCSYGFRPGRSPHDCIKDIHRTLFQWRGGYVIDADISGYFDSIDKAHLRAILDERVRDGVVRRLINKWLKAGVMEEGEVHYPETGTPQGGTISPLLSNVFLHNVLDQWFTSEVAPRMESSVQLFRFADDFIIVCRSKEDAERIMDVLPKRFERFGLALHPEKTTLLDFTRPRSDGGRPPVFNFLGFTFYWGKSRKGRSTVKLKTRKERYKRSIRKLHELCRAIRHELVTEQRKSINRVLVGLYNYYGVSFNFEQLKRLQHKAERIWHYWLNRRSQKREMPWTRFNDLLRSFPLAEPAIKVRLF